MRWRVGLLTSQGSRELFDSVALREGYKLLFIARGDAYWNLLRSGHLSVSNLSEHSLGTSEI